jgi:hypothetical protein
MTDGSLMHQDHLKAKNTEHTIMLDHPAGDSLHISSMVDLLAALEEVGQHAIESEFRMFCFFLRLGYIDCYGYVCRNKEVLVKLN